MADHHEVEAPDVAPALPERQRSTAPQSEYGRPEVLTGFIVLVVGLALTFGLALLL